MKTTQMKRRIISTLTPFLFLIIMVSPLIAQASEYNCTVTKKLNSNHEYTLEEIEKWQFSVLIHDNGNEAFISRCSFILSANKVTCDQYKADKIVFNKNVKNKKYYFFNSQFDVQLFSNLTFIENNGSGDIAFGECKITSP